MPAGQHEPQAIAYRDTVSGVELTASIDDRATSLDETARDNWFANYVDRTAPELRVMRFLIDAPVALADEMRQLRHETGAAA